MSTSSTHAARSARTRRALLDAAHQLIATDGIDGTTVASVARQASVSVGMVYHQFGSKRGLIAALIDRAIDDAKGQFADARAFRSPVERIDATGKVLLDIAARDPTAFGLMMVQALDPFAPSGTTHRGPLLLEDVFLQVESDFDHMALDRSLPKEVAVATAWAFWLGLGFSVARRDHRAIPNELAEQASEHVSLLLGLSSI